MPNQPNYEPTSGPFEDTDIKGAFGTGDLYKGVSEFSGVGAGENRYGAGLYGLPAAFSGWTGAARYSLAPMLEYTNKSKLAQDLYKNDLSKDYQKDLYSISADTYEGQAKDARRRGNQAMAQAGYGGGGGTSPFIGLQVQAESEARAGALGSAARYSVMQAQQMRAEAARGYLNSIAADLQAMLAPAQLQAAQTAKSPSGSVGPGYIAPAADAAAGVFDAGA